MKKLLSFLTLLLILNVTIYAQKNSSKINEQAVAQKIVDGLKKTINLTPAQGQQLQPIYANLIRKQNAILSNNSLNGTQKKEQLSAIALESSKQTMAILTPEQQAKIKKMADLAKEKIKAANEKHATPKK